MGLFSSTGRSEGGPRWAMYLFCAVFVLIQLVVGGRFSLFGAIPQYLLVLTAALALVSGSLTGCVAGFVCGLLFDLLGGTTVGVSALLYCVVGYVLGVNHRNMLLDGLAPSLATFSVAALCCNAAQYALLLVFGSGIGLEWVVVLRIVLATVLDVGVAALAFIVIRRFSSHPSSASDIRLL